MCRTDAIQGMKFGCLPCLRHALFPTLATEVIHWLRGSNCRLKLIVDSKPSWSHDAPEFLFSQTLTEYVPSDIQP